MDALVENIVERAIAGERIPGAELEPLFEVDTRSAEAAHVMWAAQTIARRASNNTGQIYAQIGIDALPCPVNCAFCSLAAHQSHDDAAAADAVVPLDQVVHYAQVFDCAGAHLISLMATAALPFERVRATVAAVREAVSADMPLLVNAADLSLEQARELKAAGAQAAYHAHRLGEGELTGIPSEMRLATMHNIKAAGLKLMNAVEPVHEGISAGELIARMEETAAFEPYCSGVGTLTVVAGTPMERYTPITRLRTAYYASIFRLMVAEDIPFGVGGRNVVWADAGTNPRGRDLPTSDELLERDVRRLRKQLVADEWDVPARPLANWFA